MTYPTDKGEEHEKHTSEVRIPIRIGRQAVHGNIPMLTPAGDRKIKKIRTKKKDNISHKTNSLTDKGE